MPYLLADQIRRSLDESRAGADQTIAGGASRAAELTAGALEAAQVLAEGRLEQLVRIRADIERDRVRIDAAYVKLAEGMAASCVRLVEVARQADFSPPDWPRGVGRSVEIKLSETREVTLRLASASPNGSGGGNGH